MTVRRTEKPADGPKPVKREQIGIGSYEDPAGKRGKKSGRPGR
jgi:excinuclease ABC subunit B